MVVTDGVVGQWLTEVLVVDVHGPWIRQLFKLTGGIVCVATLLLACAVESLMCRLTCSLPVEACLELRKHCTARSKPHLVTHSCIDPP